MHATWKTAPSGSLSSVMAMAPALDVLVNGEATASQPCTHSMLLSFSTMPVTARLPRTSYATPVEPAAWLICSTTLAVLLPAPRVTVVVSHCRTGCPVSAALSLAASPAAPPRPSSVAVYTTVALAPSVSPAANPA